MSNKTCLAVLLPLLTLVLKQEDHSSDLLQRCTLSLLCLTRFLLWQPHSPSVSIAIREFGPCSFDQSFVSMKYDTEWAVHFHLITLTQTQHGENPAVRGAKGSRSNTPPVCSVQENVCLKSFVLFCAFFSDMLDCVTNWVSEAYPTNEKNDSECKFVFKGFCLEFTACYCNQIRSALVPSACIYNTLGMESNMNILFRLHR